VSNPDQTRACAKGDDWMCLSSAGIKKWVYQQCRALSSTLIGCAMQTTASILSL
jgi:hypothetical protein